MHDDGPERPRIIPPEVNQPVLDLLKALEWDRVPGQHIHIEIVIAPPGDMNPVLMLRIESSEFAMSSPGDRS